MDPPKAKESGAMDWKAQEDSDEDDLPKRLPHEPTPVLPAVDAKTLTKLATLTSQAHITSLLNAANKSPRSWRQFIKFILNIGHVRPKTRETVLNSIVIGSGSVVFKQLWRESVRSTPLGADVSGNSLKDGQHADDWPSLLLLTELYTQALLTMGDDEFFSIIPASNNAAASKNPFNIGEVVSLSRKLLNIAFPLTWNDDGTSGTELVPGLPISWEMVRDRLTKCLQAIHARE
jgi:ubiquitin-protein ligase E3 C